MVGFVSAAYNATNILAALPIHALVRKQWFGRRWIFFSGTLLHLAWLTCASVLLSGAEGSGAPREAAPSDYALVFGVIVIFGCAAPVYQSQLPALLQTWYLSPWESTSAIAVYRVFFSLGFMAAQGLSIAFLHSTGKACLSQQCAIWAGVLFFSGMALLWLHVTGRRRVE